MKELAIYEETDESKAFSVPFEKLMENISQSIEQPVDFKAIAYLTRGFELQVWNLLIFSD